MFETKSELRKFATATTSIITAAALAFSLTGCTPTRTKEQDLQLQFMQSKFAANAYVEGFTPGQPDYGITIEMLLQRAGLYDNSESFKASVAAILEDDKLSGNATHTTGYLFSENSVKVDLAGKYTFASVALKADNKETREGIIALAETAYEQAQVAPTDFALSWLALGLDATQNEHVTQVARDLVAAQNTDGGFDDYTPGESTADATGLALMALAAVQDELDVKDAISKAQQYLTTTLIDGNHFESYGSANVNGTAYAFMGLKATGANSDTLATLQSWLATQLQPDGGVQAGFAPGASDTMATSQAVLAINGRTYLELL
ncbi:MAG: hypothetical protein ACKOWE_04135 [Micrococcales bacterium]